MLMEAYCALRGFAKSKIKYPNVVGKHACMKGSASLQPEPGSCSADIIIVSAGVAGAALACTLGKDGRRVHVIERDLTTPDSFSGEYLQPGGYFKLVELGLEDCLRDIDAQHVFGYTLYRDGNSITVPYPLEKFGSQAFARSFHNGRFVQKMREKAAILPNVRIEQGNVVSLLKENGTVKGVQYKTRNSLEVTSAYAPLTVVCDGCFSNIRRSLCTSKLNFSSCYVGLILENFELPHANYNNVIIADLSPIAFYPISSTKTRCMFCIPLQKLSSFGNGKMADFLKAFVAPQIPPQFHDAFMAAVEKGNMKVMKHGSMAAKPHPTPGSLLVGDALNVRCPWTGGGMTVALSEVVVLHDVLRRVYYLNNASVLCKSLQSFYTLRKPKAITINILAEGTQNLYCTLLEQATKVSFDYLSLVGILANRCAPFYSGLDPSFLNLIIQVLAMTAEGLSHMLLPFPPPKLLLLSATSAWSGCQVALPILMEEGIVETIVASVFPPYCNHITHVAISALGLPVAFFGCRNLRRIKKIMREENRK